LLLAGWVGQGPARSIHNNKTSVQNDILRAIAYRSYWVSSVFPVAVTTPSFLFLFLFLSSPTLALPFWLTTCENIQATNNLFVAFFLLTSESRRFISTRKQYQISPDYTHIVALDPDLNIPSPVRAPSTEAPDTPLEARRLCPRTGWHPQCVPVVRPTISRSASAARALLE
jgi:hypothetical protein